MDKMILLVEDNPDDEMLTIRALKKNNILNEVVVARDGVQAIDFLFGEGEHADERTKLLPVVVLTTSNEQADMISSYELGANSYIRKPVDFDQFMDAVKQLGLYWLVLNEFPGNRDSH